MPKSDDKLPPRPTLDQIIQDEALRMARSIQKPGQTKEQTKLIAQGIAKGIELYKKQQAAQARERDKARKRAIRLKQARSPTATDETAPEAVDAETGSTAPLIVAATLCALMALLHFVRLSAGWALVVGAFTIPEWASLTAAVLMAGLSAWFFREAYVTRHRLRFSEDADDSAASTQSMQ